MDVFISALFLAAIIWFVYRQSNKGADHTVITDDKPLKPLNIERPRRLETRSPRPPETEMLEGAAYVIDGDSIRIQKREIRLFGIDAPEFNHPYGKQAKWALVELCKGNRIRAEIFEVDAHGRTVARCYLPDGRDLSAEMVRVGLAIDWAKFSGGIYRDLEVPNARKKMWLADARQKGRMHVWDKFEARKASSGRAN